MTEYHDLEIEADMPEWMKNYRMAKRRGVRWACAVHEAGHGTYALKALGSPAFMKIMELPDGYPIGSTHERKDDMSFNLALGFFMGEAAELEFRDTPAPKDVPLTPLKAISTELHEAATAGTFSVDHDERALQKTVTTPTDMEAAAPWIAATAARTGRDEWELREEMAACARSFVQKERDYIHAMAYLLYALGELGLKPDSAEAAAEPIPAAVEAAKPTPRIATISPWPVDADGSTETYLAAPHIPGLLIERAEQ